MQQFTIDLNSRFPAGNPFATPLHNSLINQIKSARHERVQLTSFPSLLVMSMKCFFGKHHGTLPLILHDISNNEDILTFEICARISNNLFELEREKCVQPAFGDCSDVLSASRCEHPRHWSWETPTMNCAFLRNDCCQPAFCQSVSVVVIGSGRKWLHDLVPSAAGTQKANEMWSILLSSYMTRLDNLSTSSLTSKATPEYY